MVFIMNQIRILLNQSKAQRKNFAGTNWIYDEYGNFFSLYNHTKLDNEVILHFGKQFVTAQTDDVNNVFRNLLKVGCK